MSCPSQTCKTVCEANGVAGVVDMRQSAPNLAARPRLTGQFLTQIDSLQARRAIFRAMDTHPCLAGHGQNGHADVRMDYPGGFAIFHRMTSAGNAPNQETAENPSFYGLALFDPAGRPVDGLQVFAVSPWACFHRISGLLDQEQKVVQGEPRRAIGDKVHSWIRSQDMVITGVRNNEIHVRLKRGKSSFSGDFKTFEEEFRCLPPREDVSAFWEQWQGDWAESETRQASFVYNGQSLGGDAYYAQLVAEGYDDLIADPTRPGIALFCHPDRGLDGSQIEISEDDPLFAYIGRRHETLSELPHVYPYRQDHEGVNEALKRGLSVPPELVIQFPDLSAQYGV